MSARYEKEFKWFGEFDDPLHFVSNTFVRSQYPLKETCSSQSRMSATTHEIYSDKQRMNISICRKEIITHVLNLNKFL